MDIEQLASQSGFAGFFRRVEVALRQWNAALLRDGTDGLGEAEILHLHYEGEDVAVLVTAEAIEVARLRGVEIERAGLLFVKRTQCRIVRAGLAQGNVLADDTHHIGLLFYELSEVVGHGDGLC